MPAIQSQLSTTVDALDVREAVLGDGLVLNHTSDGGVVLHAVSAGTARELGTYRQISDAWRAIDALDLGTV